MPSMPRIPDPLPPQPTTLKQWCPACQRATPSLIIDGRVLCAICQPRGFDTPCEDEDE